MLSIDRAVHPVSDSIIYRDVYELNRAHFDGQVNYVIHPTINKESSAH
jgi:hypothetical protein